MDEPAKIAFDTETIVETLWARQIGPERYRIDNIPFFVYGVSLGDVVEARWREQDLRLHRGAPEGREQAQMRPHRGAPEGREQAQMLVEYRFDCHEDSCWGTSHVRGHERKVLLAGLVAVSEDDR